nr:hypothetical protein [Tanacetum cinerariifolium]
MLKVKIYRLALFATLLAFAVLGVCGESNMTPIFKPRSFVNEKRCKPDICYRAGLNKGNNPFCPTTGPCERDSDCKYYGKYCGSNMEPRCETYLTTCCCHKN